MTTAQLLSLLGVPAILSFLFQWIFKKVEDHKKAKSGEDDALKAGVQALLRFRLLAEADKHLSKGYCSVDNRGAFEAMATAYHNLGKNGVMDEIVERVLALPYVPEEKREQYK